VREPALNGTYGFSGEGSFLGRVAQTIAVFRAVALTTFDGKVAFAR
jgi:hypothetical protein